MRRVSLFIISLALFILSSSVFAKDANAQVFKFELANPSQTISAGADFDVKIMINTAGEQVISGDALVIFEDSKVSIKSAQTGNFFTYFSPNPITGTNNKYLVSSWEPVGSYKSASTDTLFATLTLNAKAEGSTTLSFECTSGIESESNINRASDAKDIIKCPLQVLTLNIGTGGPTNTPGPTIAPTIAPSPTSVPTATPTIVPTSTPVQPTKAPIPTVSQLPRAGAAEITVATLGIGTLLTFMGILFIL